MKDRIQGQDRAIEDEVRDLRYYEWDPLYHILQFETYVELVAALAANNNSLQFYTGLPVPRDRNLTNMIQDGVFPYNANLDGTGLQIHGQIIADEAHNSVDIRRAIIENTRWRLVVNETLRLCDHPTIYMSPGAQVSGAIATTQTLVDRVNSEHGMNHPRVYYRFGGPDQNQIPQVEREDNIVGTLFFNQALVTYLGVLAAAEVPFKDMGVLQIMASIYTWDYKPLT